MNPWQGLKGLPRAMWVLALSTLVNRLGTMVMFFLALWLVQARGWTPARAALGMALYGAGALVASPFSGWVADRWGHRRTLAWSLALSAGLLLLFPLVQAPALLLPLIAIWSAATQAYWPASMALITDLVPATDRKQAFVLHRLASNLGIAVGPALGGFIAHYSYNALFWIDAATTFLGVAVLLAWVVQPAAPPPPEQPSVSGWRDRRLLYLLAALLPATAVFTQIHGVFPLYVCRDLGHDTRTYGLLFTLNTLLILVAEVALNQRLAHWRHGRQLALGALLFGLGFGALAGFRTLPLLVVSTVIWTIGEMVFLPASSDAVATMAPADRRGQYLGLYSLTWTLAMTLGPWLGLLVYGRFGAGWLWAGCGLLGGVSALLALEVRPGLPAEPGSLAPEP